MSLDRLVIPGSEWVGDGVVYMVLPPSPVHRDRITVVVMQGPQRGTVRHLIPDAFDRLAKVA